MLEPCIGRRSIGHLLRQVPVNLWSRCWQQLLLTARYRTHSKYIFVANMRLHTRNCFPDSGLALHCGYDILTTISCAHGSASREMPKFISFQFWSWSADIIEQFYTDLTLTTFAGKLINCCTSWIPKLWSDTLSSSSKSFRTRGLMGKLRPSIILDVSSELATLKNNLSLRKEVRLLQ